MYRNVYISQINNTTTTQYLDVRNSKNNIIWLDLYVFLKEYEGVLAL